MTQNMGVTRVGDFVFAVWDGETLVDTWPCSSVKMTLAVNSLTAATVVIGCGRVLGNIEDTVDHSAELLMKEVSKRTIEGTPMVECTIHEVLGDRNTQIFKGVIVGATLVYKAGATTNRAARFECLNRACYLHMIPLGTIHYLCGSYVISEMTGQLIPPIAQYGDLYSRTVDVGSLCTTLNEKISGSADIATRISYLLEGIIAKSGGEYNTDVDLRNNNLDQINFNKYITCDYTINPALYKRVPSGKLTQAEQNATSNTNDSRFNTIDSNFNLELGRYLLSRLQNSSILEAVVGIITTSEYMMTLVPRLNGDMKLQPSRAWSNTPARTLFFSDLKSINSNVSPLAHIADPDVFIVNYSASLPMDGTVKIDGSPAALTGVYTRHKDVMEARNKLLNGETVQMGKLFANNRYKRRVYDAPTWMLDSFIGNLILSTQPEGEREQPQRVEFVPDKNQQKKDNRDPQTAYFNILDSMKMADELAKALFAFIHGRANTAEVELLPSLRFGIDGGTPLEDLIGELVDIKAPENMDKTLTKTTDDLLEIRGMITSITFSYDAGTSASCSYSMHLTRVRPLTDTEEDINCPLYALVNKSK